LHACRSTLEDPTRSPPDKFGVPVYPLSYALVIIIL